MSTRRRPVGLSRRIVVFLLAHELRYRPAVCFAAGAALAFYPGRGMAFFFFLLAASLASVGIIMRESRSRRVHLKALSILCFSVGLVSGAGFSLDEAAFGESPAALLREGALCVRALEGLPGADSVPTRSKGSSFPLLVSAVEYSGRTARGRIAFDAARIPVRIVADRDSGVETGPVLRVSGSPRAGSGGGAVLFAQADDVSVVRPAPGSDRLRSALRKTCREALAATGGQSAGFLQALLLGIKDDLDTRESDAFRNAGCSHILALSGQHLSILSALVLSCLSRPFGRRRAGIVSIVFAILFVWITGPGPSLLRSLLMVLISAAACAADRPQDGVSVLSLCFIVALPLDPAAARSLSFVLSYLAILGLVLLTIPFDYLFGKWLPPSLSEALASGCAAQVATTPVLAASFGLLVPAGLIASIVAGPCVLVLTWLALAAALVAAILPPAIPALGFVTDIPYCLLMSVMETAARCPKLVLLGSLDVVAACLVVVLSGIFVYARPYVDSRIRCPGFAEAFPRNRGTGDVQKIRPELPGQPPPA